ncbi:MAG: hypothetical protein JO257_32445 [Deltaproteobacteria bacterium]|nr:hypothetical protein [Deltaproteobacteria bacterium]
MKQLTVIALAVPLLVAACEKSDNVTQLRDQAAAVGKYYGPRADELDRRRQAIFLRGKNVPGNLPDVPEIVRLIGEAGDKINEMHGITSAIDKQADEAAKAKKVDELEKIIDESHEKLDLDETIANEDLTRVESWLWQYEQGRAAPPPAVKEVDVPPPNETTEAPPAAAGSGAGSAAAGGEKAPKADKSDKTEKAAQKAATEKADKGDKRPAPADKAAPKAGAGSAAK